MSKQKRNRLEVIFDILKIIQDNNNSIKPTPLLRKSNLSTKSFNDYEEELQKKDFVRIILDKKGRKHYSLTDKGFNYIAKYFTIKNFMNEFEI